MDRIVEITQSEQQNQKRILQNEDSIGDLWDNISHPNINILGIPEGEEEEKGAESVFEEIISENFSN